MATPPAQLPHLLVFGTAKAEKYIAHSAGGPSSKQQVRDRAEHGTQIRDQLTKAWKDALADRGTIARPHGGDDGAYIEFESPPGVQLALQSLESARAKIELVAVRRDDDVERAAVFVPAESQGHFLKIVDEFLTKETKSDRPRHEPLLASIAAVHAAVLESLWTDDPASIPAPGVSARWEVWLRREPSTTAEVTLQRFRAFAVAQKILVSENHLTFLDRLVVHAIATREQLAASIGVLSAVAEFRLAKESAEFFTRMDRLEQREWVKDLATRIVAAPPDAPSVCLLDTGATRAHPLLEKSLDSNDQHTYENRWGVHDHDGHGTEMAGLALLGDLTDALAARGPVQLTHRLETAKILPPRSNGRNPEELWGIITAASLARAEIQAPLRRRVACLAVASRDTRDRGFPSSWSAEIDKLAFGDDGDPTSRRLFVISAGNIETPDLPNYPASNEAEGIHDPGQAWNAITVGAYTEKALIAEPHFSGWNSVAPIGDASPCTTTSITWQSEWPYKPDLMMEGGNAALDPARHQSDTPDSLSLLSTYYQPLVKQVTTTGDTSAAAALAARMAAQIHAQYPDLWPEAVRALMVHSADWTRAMRRRYPRKGAHEDPKLLRSFGYGVPDLGRALWSAKNSLTLLAQASLQPFEKDRSKEMHVHHLPWPARELQALGETRVELRISLSYFIEPNPARRGWNKRHRYASHGLRFDVNSPSESLDEFRRRLNRAASDDDGGSKGRGDAAKWRLGPTLRARGSVQSDRWTGTGAELAQRSYLAVYPVIGWWRERHQLERWKQHVRYALVVTIHTASTKVDLYTPVATQIAAATAVST